MDVDALLEWYAHVRRPLPWRFTRDPYAVLVSELMLQQTQAARVVPYYERWLVRFPTAATLAAAPVRDVLAAWSGLGYNRRALALQQAARQVSASGWPPAERLTELPGVGPYTAAALASFAWDAPVAAADTNARRVIERRDGRRRTPAELARRLAELLPRDRAAAFNQAMMELGATVCRPRRPRCDACPVRAGCRSQGPGEGPRRDRRGIRTEGRADGPRLEGRAEEPRLDGYAAEGRRGAARPVRFEDTDRWARGRLLAALIGRRPPPELEPARRERALAGLERDGLVVRGADGEPRLP
jgi:A/G-specific adenine glycosylase